MAEDLGPVERPSSPDHCANCGRYTFDRETGKCTECGYSTSDDDIPDEISLHQWLEDNYAIDTSDNRQLWYVMGLIGQAEWYMRRLPLFDEFSTYFNDALYHQADPLSFHDWLQIEGREGYQAYVVIGLLGGIMTEHEVFMDWRLAYRKVEDLKDSYNIKTVEIEPKDHHMWAHDGDPDHEHPYIENQIFVLPSKLTWENAPCSPPGTPRSTTMCLLEKGETCADCEWYPGAEEDG